MEIKLLTTEIATIAFEKKNPNSSVSGNQEEPTYHVRVFRLEKTYAFSHSEIAFIYNYLDTMDGMVHVSTNYKLIKDNKDEIVLNYVEAGQLRSAISQYSRDFIPFDKE